MVRPEEEIMNTANEVIAKYVDTSTINLNKLIDGSSVNRPTTSNSIAIENCKTFEWIRFKGDIIFFPLLLKMMADILKFTETPLVDEGIEEYEYPEYDPITGTNLNNCSDIRICIESLDVFTHPSESY